MIPALLGLLAARRRTAEGPSPSMLDLSGESYIGNMTTNGGLAAAFDGDIEALNGDAAVRAPVSGSYVGVDMGAGSILPTSITCLGSGQSGFAGSATPTIRLDCYVSNSAPSNSTDGTKIGDSGTINHDDPSAVLSISTASSWRYLWVAYIVISGSAGTAIMAEMQVTGFVS